MDEGHILHIAVDEKFINSANWLFEAAFPGQNTFFILVKEPEKPLKHVVAKPNVHIKEDCRSTLNNIQSVLKNYSLVVLHSLDFLQSRLVLKSDSTVRFLWLFWGWEIYNNELAFGKQFIGPLSKALVKKESLAAQVKEALRPFYSKLVYGTSHRERAILQAAQKVQYIGLQIWEDFELLRDESLISCKHVSFSYYPLEFIFNGNEDCMVNEGNILLGNSAALTNNHPEAFKLLSGLELGERKVITPLSYSDGLGVDKIVEIGREYIGSNLLPLIEFMPLVEYNRLLQQCGIVVMNHYRQQAIGNIMAMLWMGAKVYLDERNPIFKYLKRLGILVFSIDKHLVPENEQVFKLLNSAEVESNRSKLLPEIGGDYLIRSMIRQLGPILK